ncbi:helix-turn-helix transcriptional regulator [Actinomadura sp. NTSP31]|uniref:helix-turn-helix transcriptional regulator n=1 Tax=Actinomadura sp. NTSP31 TaxID=1735447 RepID=UPI0035C030E3
MTDEDASGRRAELAAFLRARRSGLAPADVGLPPGRGRRRTPGLRREELAQLSGVGLTWYTWLEQARDIPASAQVVDALARALRLGPAEHRHLRALADLPPPPPVPPPPGALGRLQRLIDSAAPSPAAVYDLHYDYLAWNLPYCRVRHDPASVPPDRRNLLWFVFTDPGVRASLPRWWHVARSVLGQFRAAAGRRPGDARFTEITEGLTAASPEFGQWWPDYAVGDFRPTTITVTHPSAGPIELELFHLHPSDHPDFRVVTEVPASPDDLRKVRAALTSR